MDTTLDRRAFLGLGAAACGVLATRAILPSVAWAETGPADLAACKAMTPQDMANASPLVADSWRYLQEVSATISDKSTRVVVQEILDNPAPSVAGPFMDAKARREVFEELSAKGYLKGQTVEGLLPPTTDPKKATQPFRCAPGSGYQSHHAFPGGLVVHTAGNMRNTLGIFDSYKKTYNFDLDRDAVVVSQMLHDLHKPWVFAWGGNGASREEQTLAGTGEHHVLSVAEFIVHKLPAPMIVAQACAHNHPGSAKDEAEVVGWIKAASILAGVDPVVFGLLEKGGETLPLPRRMEGFVCHLGDHDWVLTVPAGKWMIPALAELAKERYGIADANAADFNHFRNYVFAQNTMMGLYEIYATTGKDGLAEAVAKIVKPV